MNLIQNLFKKNSFLSFSYDIMTKIWRSCYDYLILKLLLMISSYIYHMHMSHISHISQVFLRTINFD